jgi:hypothetical protein
MTTQLSDEGIFTASRFMHFTCEYAAAYDGVFVESCRQISLQALSSFKTRVRLACELQSHAAFFGVRTDQSFFSLAGDHHKSILFKKLSRDCSISFGYRCLGRDWKAGML